MILAATRALVLSSGYEALTMEGIAATAGVGKQTVYRWWPSKAAVVADAFLDDWSVTPVLPTKAPRGSGVAWVRDVADFFASDVGTSITRALTAAAAEDAVIAGRLDAVFTEPFRSGIVRWLADAVPNDRSDADQARQAAADMILGALVFRVLARTEPLSRRRAEQVLELALRGLRASQPDS